MQLMIDAADVATAPIEVRTWLANVLALEPATPVTLETVIEEPQTKPKAEKVAEPKDETSELEAAADVPDIKEVMSRAVELISAKGEDVLAEILQKLEIRRVKECPEDKRAALLAEIAIHA